MKKKSLKDLCVAATIFTGGCIVGRLDCMLNILRHNEDMESVTYKGKYMTSKIFRKSSKEEA